MGLYLFFLPTSSPELNLIDGEWNQIKTHEICDRMFEDEYDLVRVVKEILKNRSSQVGYQLQQWITYRNIENKIEKVFNV